MDNIDLFCYNKSKQEYNIHVQQTQIISGVWQETEGR